MDNLALTIKNRQFGTRTIWHQTIWHNLLNLYCQQFEIKQLQHFLSENFDENFLKTGGGSRDIVDNPLPVQNAAVLLYNEAGELLSFTTTDEFGDFNFDNSD